MSKDIPIIFSAPMVCALLEGRKTMTRRLAWRDAKFGLQDYASEQLEDMELRGWDVVGEGNEGFFRVYKPTSWQSVKSGDRMWVRENWRPHGDSPLSECVDSTDVQFAASADEASLAIHKWRPSIHMPRWASRLTLTVTGVKVERLQDISSDDCIAEGEGRPVGTELVYGSVTPAWNVRAFSALWSNLHGDASWKENPFVVAIAFRIIKVNIDSPQARRAA